MRTYIKLGASLALAAAILAGPAAAQTKSEETKPGEAQSSTMGPASGNRDGANNGVGTAGSLTHDAGTASSKVSAANTNLGGASKGADKPVERDPAQGGAKQ